MEKADLLVTNFNYQGVDYSCIVTDKVKNKNGIEISKRIYDVYLKDDARPVKKEYPKGSQYPVWVLTLKVVAAVEALTISELLVDDNPDDLEDNAITPDEKNSSPYYDLALGIAIEDSLRRNLKGRVTLITDNLNETGSALTKIGRMHLAGIDDPVKHIEELRDKTLDSRMFNLKLRAETHKKALEGKPAGYRMSAEEQAAVDKTIDEGSRELPDGTLTLQVTEKDPVVREHSAILTDEQWAAIEESLKKDKQPAENGAGNGDGAENGWFKRAFDYICCCGCIAALFNAIFGPREDNG